MSGRLLAAVASASALCALILSGCTGPLANWPFPPLMRPPQPAYSPPLYVPSQSPPPAGESHTSERSRERQRADSRTRPTQRTPPAAPPAEATPQPTVTLAGDGADRDRALRLLDDAGARLSKIDRNKLRADSAATYDQANDFLNAGRKAALDQDYVAATGDAEKASVLADKLTAGSH